MPLYEGKAVFVALFRLLQAAIVCAGILFVGSCLLSWHPFALGWPLLQIATVIAFVLILVHGVRGIE